MIPIVPLDWSGGTVYYVYIKNRVGGFIGVVKEKVV